MRSEWKIRERRKFQEEFPHEDFCFCFLPVRDTHYPADDTQPGRRQRWARIEFVIPSDVAKGNRR